MRFLPRFLAGLLVLLALAVPAAAEEQIRAFSSNVVVGTDSSVDVTETIDVNAEGYKIKHGIFRDIPLVLLNPDNSKLHSNLNVISVTRDGQPEPYTTEGITNGVRIKIGDGDVNLDYRTYRYIIRYTMTRMARRFPDHDELFWNATGNYWDFPILSAVSTVTLPDGAVISQLKAYTGRFGSLEQAATVQKTSERSALFRATRTLGPGEGMTVAVAFQPGILAEPSTYQKALYWLSDRREILVPGLAIFLVLLYNLFAWDAVGRDPKKGTIIPLFHPPEGFSPAQLHHIHNLGWKQSGWTAFTASIFDLGVKGLVTIDNEAKKLKVTITGRKPESPLPGDEQRLFSYFNANASVTVDKSTGPDLEKQRKQLVSGIEGDSGGVYFNTNLGYVAVGALLAIACLGGMVWLGVLELVWLIGAIVGGAVLGFIGAFFGKFSTGSFFGRVFTVIWIAAVAINVLGSLSGLLVNPQINTAALSSVSIVVITVIFAILMRAPTVAGRKLMDQIDGFIMYLNTAEKNRLNLVGEPPMTIKRFEAILPFAIALGVEKPWSRKFEDALARNAVADARGGVYAPYWYSGRDFSSNNFSNSIAAVSSGMSAAMIAAQPAQSSSSGFSGGGGSGGGGGGGGGGGW
ncbi:MAG: putative rane protein precursor [Hyphomicrobiales bacterium]|nr:putative rane protein precursor [Hyphomicrobiales bacterium]